MEKIYTHLTDAKNRLIEQYKNSTNLKILIDSIVTPIQTIEDEMFKLYDNRWLNTAVGYQLDQIGKIVGEDRNKRTDYDYRQALYIRIKINIGNGEPETIIDFAKWLYNSNKIEYSDKFPCFYQLLIISDLVINNSVSLFKSISPICISKPIIILSNTDNVFRFSKAVTSSNNYKVLKDGTSFDFKIRTNNTVNEFKVRSQTIFSNYKNEGFGKANINTYNLKIDKVDRYITGVNVPLKLRSNIQDVTIDKKGAKLAKVLI